MPARPGNMQPRNVVALPTATSVKSRKQLHTAFWAHGAAGIELFDACQALQGTAEGLRCSAPAVGKQSPDKPGSVDRPDPMTASTFLLDFLYPYGARAFEKLSPGLPERQSKTLHHSKGAGIPRLYSGYPATSPTRSTHGPEPDDASPQPHFGSANPPQSRTGTAVYGGTADSRGDALDLAHLEVDGGFKDDLGFACDNLRELLGSDHAGTSDRVWSLYTTLSPERKSEFRNDVLGYLGASDRPVEAWRALEIFSELGLDEWTGDRVHTAIKAHLILDHVPSAVQIFNEAVNHGIAQGLEPILVYAFKTSSWALALEAWEIFTTKFGVDLPDADFEPITAVPDLSRKLSRFYDYVSSQAGAQTSDRLREQVDALLRYVATDTLASFRTPDVLSILDRVGTYKEYEDFIGICMERDQKKLAGQMYWKYRSLPGVRIRVFVLRHMLSVFHPHDARGMEQVLRDWYGRYDHLDAHAYHKFIAFYAGRGDTRTVLNLLAEYRRHYAGARTDRAVLSALMHSHAVRGEVGKARQIIESSRRNLGREPNSIELNILLNAHAKAWDFDGAIDTFAQICESGKADTYSFGTFMAMAGGRGDLHLCLDLYRTARRIGLQPDVAMIDALVEAYCQNDQFSEAEFLCNRVTREKTVKGNYTALWNTLLNHYAYRRDLTNVNRILERMVKYKVPYDSRTYEYLLQALVYCGQSQQALRLIRTAQKEQVFEPTLSHYLLLMSAFIRTREPHIALRFNEIIQHIDHAGTADRVTKVIEALGRWQEIPEKARRGEGAEHYMQAAFREFNKSLGREDRTVRDDRRSVARQYSKMMFILTQMRDFASVKQILSLYKEQFPGAATPQTLPLKLLSSIMLADFYEGSFDRVKSTWASVLERTKGLGKEQAERTGKGARGWPSRCYILSDPLKTMQRVYLAERDPEGLLNLVRDVEERGFELDSKNWNYHIQALARLKQLREAFTICEEVLMPQWTGWKRVRAKENVKNQLPLELRRLGRSPRYLRPISYTLLVLAREYMDLERITPWSVGAARLFNDINEDCARVVQAIKTMVLRGDSAEERILAGDGGDGNSRFSSGGDPHGGPPHEGAWDVFSDGIFPTGGKRGAGLSRDEPGGAERPGGVQRNGENA